MRIERASQVRKDLSFAPERPSPHALFPKCFDEGTPGPGADRGGPAADGLRGDTDAERLFGVIRRNVGLHDLTAPEKRAGSKIPIKTRDGQSRQLEFL